MRCNLKPGINGDAVEVLKLAACRPVDGLDRQWIEDGRLPLLAHG
jgi:hypothetical protein